MPKRSSWTKPEIDLCLKLRSEEKKQWSEIGEILGRSRTAVQAKFDYMTSGMNRRKYSRTHKVIAKSIAPIIQQQDRAARYEAGWLDQTAEFFGDPPAGYSALDQRMQHEADTDSRSPAALASISASSQGRATAWSDFLLTKALQSSGRFGSSVEGHREQTVEA